MIKLGANKWDFLEEHILGTISIFLYIAATLLVVEEALRRYIFGDTFYWSSEVIVYFFLVGSYLYMATCLKVGSHLKVGFLMEHLKTRLRDTISSVILLVSAAYCVIFIVGLVPAFQTALKIGLTTENARIPFTLIHALLGLGFLMFAIRYVLQAYHLIKGSKS